MEMLGAINPLAWVHFRMRGGWKNIAATSAAYTAIIVALIVISLRSDPSASKNVLYFWTNGLLALQIGTLLLFAAGAIRNAVRKDLTTRMIESHRLMPMSGAQAMMGYVIGPAMQAAALTCVNFCLGVMTAAAAGLSLSDWILANFILGIFAACAWLGVAFFAMLSPAAVGVLVAGLVVCFMSSGTPLAMLPGLAVLTGPLIGNTIFGIIERGGNWSWAYQVSMLSQAAAAGFCFIAGARKYRREDVPALGPGMGLLLLLGWVCLSVLGIVWPREFQSTYWGGFNADSMLQMTGSTLFALLVGIVPVSSAALLWSRYERHRALGDPVPMARPTSALLVAICAGMVASLLPSHARFNAMPAPVMATGMGVAFLVSVRYLLGIVYRRGSNAFVLLLLWVLVTWLAPLLGDVLYFAASGQDELTLTWISTMSPIGLLLRLVSMEPQPVTIGLVVQLAMALCFALAYHLTLRRRPA